MAQFDPYEHKQQLLPLFDAIIGEEDLTGKRLYQLLRAYPQAGGGVFSKRPTWTLSRRFA